MQGYNPGFHGRHLPVAQSSQTLHDRESPSGSDDELGDLMYPDYHKMETFYDDDPNALTSQSLNADGTPKRPMNAFMIFARRRRPQVSAENQSMRTGEVSKILSREWNTMNMPDKQFYLDQAKQLKDSFNQKYPDYVYKRRPNNSRKRRKPDPAPGPSADQASTSDLTEDYPGGAEYSDVSPVDVADTDDPRISEQDIHVSLPADSSEAMYSTSPSRASSHQPPDVPYRSPGDTRAPYSSRPGRATPDSVVGSSISPSRGSEHGTNYYQLYLTPQQQHHAPSSSYFTESGSAGESWLGARDDQSRMHVQSWSQNSHDLAGDDRHRGYPQPGSSHTWTNTSVSEGLPLARSTGTPSAAFNFPTHTASFYPPQSNSQEGFPSSSVQPVSVPSQHFGAVASASGNPVSGGPYSSLQQAFGHTSGSLVSSYHQPQARTVSHSLSSAQSMSSYTQAQTTNPPPPAGSGGDPSQMHYWSRERRNT